MAILTVTSASSSGAGSLAEQVALSQSNGVGADTIVFDAALAGQTIRPQDSDVTFLLEIQQGTLTIDGDIDGDGFADITLSGDVEGDGIADSALVLVRDGANVTLSGITFTDARSRLSEPFFQQDQQRSVIDNEGVLVIENSAIIGNESVAPQRDYSAAIIENGGLLTVRDTLIAGNYTRGSDGYGGNNTIWEGGDAGTIINDSTGTLNIDDVTFYGNGAFAGAGGRGSTNYGSFTGATGGDAAGGILNRGSLSVEDSLFSSNGAYGGWGGNGGDYDIAYGESGQQGGQGGDAAGAILNVSLGPSADITSTGFLYNYARSGGGGNGGNARDYYNGTDYGAYLYVNGDGGDAGFAAGSILNIGTMDGDGWEDGSLGIAGTVGMGGTASGTTPGSPGTAPAAVNDFSQQGSGNFALLALSNAATPGDDVLGGSLDDDFIDGLAGDDILFGRQGDDLLRGGAGADILVGGLGFDGADYENSWRGVEIDLEQGTGRFGEAHLDTLISIEGAIGSTLDDTLSGSGGNDAFFGKDGNDVIRGKGGDDLLSGDDGDDLVIGGDGRDILSGGNGNDTVNGNDGVDLVQGGAGDDRVTGGLGSDEVDGNEGNDVVLGQSGNDILRGGEGDDILEGGRNNDSLFGDTDSDALYGEQGSDLLDGGTGNDTLFGGTGNDMLDGNDGNDALYGGDQSDSLFGALGDDFLYGEAGLDDLSGGDGNDRLNGGDNSDTLSGDAGDDVLIGAGGADRLDGGTGNDTMNGGVDGNRDTFVFGIGSDQDRINAYEQGTDRLEIDNALWAGDPRITNRQDIVDTFGSLNTNGTILTLDFGGSDILEIQNAASIDDLTLGSDFIIV